jgi:hypothetical protein
MEIIQKNNQSGQKQGLNLIVNFVKNYLGNQEVSMQKRKSIIAQHYVTLKTEKKIGNQKNKIHGKVELLHTKLIEDGLRKTQNVCHISKHEGMQEKRMPKALTLLRIGKSYVNSLITNVLNVYKLRNLPKTILNHYQKVGVITFQTYSHFVGIVIVENGKLTFMRTLN